MRPALAVLVAVTALTSACAPLRRGPQAAELDQKRVRLEVPFFKNEDNLCGPAALASVLKFYGQPADPAQLREDIYRQRLQGSLTIDLLLAAQARGMTVDMADGDLDAVKKNLDEGRPVIAFIDVGKWLYPVGHYIVLTGYDDKKGGVYAHSGLTAHKFLTYKQFESRWEKTGQWTLLVQPPSAVLPPDTLSESLSQLPY